MKTFLPLLLLLALFNTARANDMLAFHHTYIVAAPPGVDTMAAYFTVINPGDKDKKIMHIASDQFKSAEMHRSIIEDGIARMEKLDTLTVPAHSQVEFAPGGLHVMLTGPKQPVLPGEFVILQLEEADGTEHNLAVKVIFTKTDQENPEKPKGTANGRE